jgi:transglutaminase-like putative cysteine protease
MELRMAPRQESDQHRLSFTLALGPAAQALSYFDWLGNTVHAFSINQFHKQIRIQATSVVETDRPRPPVEKFADRWPVRLEQPSTRGRPWSREAPRW